MTAGECCRILKRVSPDTVVIFRNDGAVSLEPAAYCEGKSAEPDRYWRGGWHPCILVRLGKLF